MRILLMNGPNLNLLGTREPHIYGTSTLADIVRMVEGRAASYGAELRSYQANSDGQLIDWLQQEQREADGLILNAGALTHSSIALADAVAGSELPTIEVHISNVWKREPFRHHSYLSPIVKGAIVGLGVHGYVLAFDALMQVLKEGA
jgi:3-dehydroquinate dehydratase-2